MKRPVKSLSPYQKPRIRTEPEWTAVEAHEDAGGKLIEFWRSYAATAARPYGSSAFAKQFRRWQVSRPIDTLAEFKASDIHWKGKAQVRPDILALGDGATIRVRGGHLSIYDAGKETLFDGGPTHRKPRAVVFSGWGGSVTVQAARFCADHDITVMAAGWLGELMTFVQGSPKQDAALIRAQCSANATAIAQALIIKKFDHYGATGRLTTAERHTFKQRLAKARTIKDVMAIEAVGSAQAWVSWRGLQLMPRTGRRLPAFAAGPFCGRNSGIGSSGARNASDPINAMLNYCYAREAGRLGAMLAASGAALAIGSLHQDKLHRASLVFDALEPLRPLIDARVRNFIETHTFDRGDFFKVDRNMIRLHTSLIKVLISETALDQADVAPASRFMLSLIHRFARR
jgi:CRISPR-associated endonuclease Cas1